MKYDPIYVFDLDGVITDPQDTQVNLSVVDAIYQLLDTGTAVAVNTGRSFEWVERNLVEQLATHHDDDIFSRFICVCEKGGETVFYREQKPVLEPSQFALPPSVYTAAKAVFEQNKARLNTMFWDETKRTMATIEKQPQATLSDFHTEQRLLAELLATGLAAYDVRIDPTTIATDVESPLAGKDSGAQLIYEWAQGETVLGDGSFVSIGDSISDYEMARRFADQGAKSTFVYVGEPTNQILHNERVTFVTTKNHFALGTLEYLQSLV